MSIVEIILKVVISLELWISVLAVIIIMGIADYIGLYGVKPVCTKSTKDSDDQRSPDERGTSGVR